jgi:heme/copper-type cytochrome/quinol oxidase subunit 3
MSTAIEQMHELEPHIRVGRARAGVIMLILSDALSVMAILAAGGYLNSLNVLGQFRGGDHAPPFLPGLLLAIVLVLSGLVYYLWERTARNNGGARGASQPVFLILALLLMVVGLAVQIGIGASLRFSVPFHAYASVILLITWFTAVHLLLAAFIGLLLIGRLLRGRLAGHAYIAEVVGYWWYYTVVASLLLWLFILLLG